MSRAYDILADVVARVIASCLPKRVRYWSYIRAGVEHIEPYEIVPEVTYGEILQRLPK